jgi:hypothetical protein
MNFKQYQLFFFMTNLGKSYVQSTMFCLQTNCYLTRIFEEIQVYRTISYHNRCGLKLIQNHNIKHLITIILILYELRALYFINKQIKYKRPKYIIVWQQMV